VSPQRPNSFLDAFDLQQVGSHLGCLAGTNFFQSNREIFQSNRKEVKRPPWTIWFPGWFQWDDPLGSPGTSKE